MARSSYTGTVRSSYENSIYFSRAGLEYIGMGKSLTERFSSARQIFDTADQVLGFSLTQLCFEGPADVLQLTENQQPALLTVSVAAFGVLAEQGMKSDFVAGHSLGEYSA